MLAIRSSRRAATFNDYLVSHARRALLSGPPLDRSVRRRLPRILARLVFCGRLRAQIERQGGPRVPAIVFLAVTGACNLRCPHCYTRGYRPEHMDLDLARHIVVQAYDLGVSLIIVTGGEPLLNRPFFDVPRERPDMPFLVFTNGALVPEFLESEDVPANLLWSVSVDGPPAVNDARRGAGAWGGAEDAMAALARRRLPFGFAATLSEDNVEAALAPDFVHSMATRGCRAGFFLEQIPSPPADPPLAVRIARRLDGCRRSAPIPLLGFPGDEARYGGCQAGGHGIVHISPRGDVEPCPAAHLAADSLRDTPLRCALAHPFLRAFRDMKEDVGGGESCAYAAHAARFHAALAALGARATEGLPRGG